MKGNRLLVFGFLLAALAAYAACRKIDIPEGNEKELTPERKQLKFYNSHPSSDPHVKALNAYLQRQNVQSDFVEKTIERVGYPIWAKTQISKTGDLSGRSMEDSVTYVYIPFSRENENIVNASLIIRTTSSDTTTDWVCDWQYTDKPRGSISLPGTAENLAVFFMRFQHAIFGDSIFAITDSTLFSGWGTWGIRERRAKIKSLSNGGRGNNQPVYECIDFYECGTPDWCYAHGGCDYLNCPTYQCFLTESYCSCVSNCSGGSGATGGGGSGTGGGGSDTGGGGGTPPPPECQPVANKGNNVTPPGEGCPPGWNPPPPPPSPPEPIDSMLARYSRSINSTADSIFALSMANNYEEWGFPFVQKNGLVYPKRCTTIHNIQMVILDRYKDVGETIMGELHTHPDPSPNPLSRSAPSGDDLETLNINSRLNYTVFVECGNVRYALVIENVSLARAFLGINPTDVLSNNQTIVAQQQPNWQNNWQSATQVALAQLIGSSTSSGIGFYISDATKTNYTKIN